MCVCVCIYIHPYTYMCTAFLLMRVLMFPLPFAQFEQPLPPLLPAVFPPSLREPPPPALDLYDLDEQFASEKVKGLTHLRPGGPTGMVTI